jgi:hypothetical protein
VWSPFPDVDRAIRFPKQKVNRLRLPIVANIVPLLSKFGHTSVAKWIQSHQHEYLGSLKYGYEVETLIPQT